MSSSVDDLVRGVMRTLAGEIRVPDGFAVRATARGRRLRRHRRLGGSAAALTAVAALAVPYLAVPRDAHRAGPGPTTTASPSTPVSPSPSVSPPPSRPPRSTGPTTLPEADGVPGAIDEPSLVGSNPGIVHFDLDPPLRTSVTQTMWTTQPGVEDIGVSYESSNVTIRDLGVTVTSSPAEADRRAGWYSGGIPLRQETTSVHGRTATLVEYAPPDSTPPTPPTWVLQWQPVDGLWVVLVARDTTDRNVRQAAEKLRLDRAQHCVQPIGTRFVPAGARWTGCNVAVAARADADPGVKPGIGVWWYSGFSLARGSSAALDVRLEPSPRDRSLGGPKDEFHPNRTAAGWPAMWTVHEGGYGELRINDYAGRFDLYVSCRLADFTEADVLQVAAALFLTGDLAKPATWPRSPVP